MGKFRELESVIIKFYDKVHHKKVGFSDIITMKPVVAGYVKSVIEDDKIPSDNGLYSVLMLALDQYTYGEGDVLITDHEYDIVHRIYMNRGHDMIVYADIFDSTWKEVKHNAPFMVGTVKKTYALSELRDYIHDIMNRYNQAPDIKWVVAPKFDGISGNIEIHNNQIVQGITRGDREFGQDITEIVKRVHNRMDIERNPLFENGFLKVELCVPQEEFEYLKDEYANRRSATSAIINSPKNIDKAVHIDAIPLLFYNSKGEIWYKPQDSVTLSAPTPDVLINTALDLLHKVKNREYKYRVDGVVLYPLVTDTNTTDVMENSKAFKINTAEAETTLDYVYISVGLTGKAVPMAKVKPCEVNETEVTDISLGSFDIFRQMGLHEGESVIAFAAGDVIPHLKQFDPQKYPKNSPLIKLKMECPYCGEPLENESCVNPRCIRVAAGRITNFLARLGVEDFSYETVAMLYLNHRISNVEDLFDLTDDALRGIKSLGELKKSAILSKIDSLRNNTITYGKFFGALQIPGMSEKMCSKIFSSLSVDYFMEMKDNDLRDYLFGLDDFGPSRSDTLIKFRNEHRYEIKNLMSKMNLIKDKEYFGTVVLTGFRDPHLAEKFDSLGLKLAANVTKSTLCVVAARLDTGNAIAAQRKNIPLFLNSEADKAIKYCIRMLK